MRETGRGRENVQFMNDTLKLTDDQVLTRARSMP